jgi:transcriptional regulator with XRE-family HTH domain
MDDLRVGLVLRALRRRLGWRQLDVAARAGVSQRLVSLAEAGQLERLTLRSLRAIGRALEVRVPVEPLWRGGQLPRLLDGEHAALVNAVAAIMRRRGWQILVEYTFNHFGDRGSVDLVGWHPQHRALVLVEVKSRITDVQDLHSAMARKRRIVPSLLTKELGWRPMTVGQLLVVGEASGQRRLVDRHSEIFAATFAQRGREARAWLAHPAGTLSALWFLSPSNGVTAKRRERLPQRIRSQNSRSASPARRPQAPPKSLTSNQVADRRQADAPASE